VLSRLAIFPKGRLGTDVSLLSGFLNPLKGFGLVFFDTTASGKHHAEGPLSVCVTMRGGFFELIPVGGGWLRPYA
jgi:hypothetical protein